MSGTSASRTPLTWAGPSWMGLDGDKAGWYVGLDLEIITLWLQVLLNKHTSHSLWGALAMRWIVDDLDGCSIRGLASAAQSAGTPSRLSCRRFSRRLAWWWVLMIYLSKL